MQQKKRQEILRVIGGILFVLLIFPAAFLMLIGIFELSKFIKARFPASLSLSLIIIILLFLIIITAISKANIGGDALKISMRELFKKKEKRGKR
jgi:uncharacterized membrane protein